MPSPIDIRMPWRIWEGSRLLEGMSGTGGRTLKPGCRRNTRLNGALGRLVFVITPLGRVLDPDIAARRVDLKHDVLHRRHKKLFARDGADHIYIITASRQQIFDDTHLHIIGREHW